MSRRRGRGRGGIFFPKPPQVSEESKPGEEPAVGPPPLFPVSILIEAADLIHCFERNLTVFLKFRTLTNMVMNCW